MKKDKFGIILGCALRYALGRRTYIVSIITDYIIENIDDIETRDLIVMKRDIEEKRDDPWGSKPLGDDCDVKDWMNLLSNINEEIKRRQELENNSSN